MLYDVHHFAEEATSRNVDARPTMTCSLSAQAPDDHLSHPQPATPRQPYGLRGVRMTVNARRPRMNRLMWQTLTPVTPGGLQDACHREPTLALKSIRRINERQRHSSCTNQFSSDFDRRWLARRIVSGLYAENHLAKE